jgi:2,3-bisphosphoglycerate-independent phosphoglycerate mutase
MKTILIILDGISENKINLLDNKSPLEYAFTPTLDLIKSQGFHCKTKFHHSKKSANSLNCISKIIGLKGKNIPKHRSYLESLTYDIPVNDDEWVLRCNLISMKENKLYSFNSIGMTKNEKKCLSKTIHIPEGLKYYHLNDYKNLLIIKSKRNFNHLSGFYPHENIGENLTQYINKVYAIDTLKDFMENNKKHINGIYYMYLPWGPSKPFDIPTFHSLHNKSAFSVSHTELVKGLFKKMNIKSVQLNNSTGDIDTDLVEKTNAVIKNYDKYDVTITHINGTDEVSHRKNLTGKINFIKKIDKEVLKPIYQSIGKNVKIIILSDHQTSSLTGEHEPGFVDLICNKKNINKNNLFKE